jgi:hypothetical protein
MADLYSCTSVPDRLTVGEAHRIMQIHLHCPTRYCASRSAAVGVLRGEGRYRLDYRSELG